MQPNLKNNPKKRPVLLAIYRKITLRQIVQMSVAILMLYAAWEFYHFVNYIRWDSSGPEAYRPPVAEGFLPVAALVALKAFVGTGQFDRIHPAGLVILLTALATAWLFRRALCSWICPLGTLSEYLGRLGVKLMGHQVTVPGWLDRILLAIKYLLFTAIFYFFVIYFSTDAAISFLQSPYYAISDIKMFDFFSNIGIIGIMVITLLIVLSILIKSFWCRYLCPYGAFLGLLGLLSPFALVRDDKICIRCGKCNRACPNKVDLEGKKHLVMSTECTGCTGCVTVCPKEGALRIKLFGKLPVKPLVFSIAFLAVFFGIILAAKLTGYWDTSLSLNEYQTFDRIMSSGFSI